MPKVRIFTDSISDIPQDWISQYNIVMIPLYIVFQEKSYQDRIEINTVEMYSMVEKYGSLPKTSAPSPVDFIKHFGSAIENGEDVLYISMSSRLSATYQNACLAAREFPFGRVTVVDSLNVSAGMALIVRLASQMAEQGRSALSIAEELSNIRNDVQMYVLVDQLDYLHKGGRVGNMQQLLGNVFHVRPLLYVKQGEVLSRGLYRGSMKKKIKNLVQNLLEDTNRIHRDQIIISQTMEEETAAWIRSMILEESDIRNVYIIEGGCAICSHSGPHSLGISYMLKSQPEWRSSINYY